MEQLIADLKPGLEKIIEFFKEELAGLRTGRASVAIVENIMVDCYGSKTPLKQLAAISVTDSQGMVVQPWDKTVVKEIEKAISQSGKGLSVSVDGAIVRLAVPPMTEERRKEIVKVLKEKLEAARVAVRELRDKTREKINKLFKDKSVTEDDRYGLFEDIDKITGEYNEKIKKIQEEKEAEIMTV